MESRAIRFPPQITRMEAGSHKDLPSTSPAPRVRMFPLISAYLVVVCLMGLMAMAKGNSFVPKLNHSQQYAETLTKKHVVHTPTFIVREPLPVAGGSPPVPLVTPVARLDQAEARLSPEMGVFSPIRGRSPPLSLS
jgi:hypothetical protein